MVKEPVFDLYPHPRVQIPGRGGRADRARPSGERGEKRGKGREICTYTYRDKTPPAPTEQQKRKKEQRGGDRERKNENKEERGGF